MNIASTIILGFKDSVVALVLVGALILIFIPISDALGGAYTNTGAQFVSNYAPLFLLGILLVFVWGRLGGSGYEP